MDSLYWSEFHQTNKMPHTFVPNQGWLMVGSSSTSWLLSRTRKHNELIHMRLIRKTQPCGLTCWTTSSLIQYSACVGPLIGRCWCGTQSPRRMVFRKSVVFAKVGMMLNEGAYQRRMGEFEAAHAARVRSLLTWFVVVHIYSVTIQPSINIH